MNRRERRGKENTASRYTRFQGCKLQENDILLSILTSLYSISTRTNKQTHNWTAQRPINENAQPRLDSSINKTPPKVNNQQSRNCRNTERPSSLEKRMCKLLYTDCIAYIRLMVILSTVPMPTTEVLIQPCGCKPLSLKLYFH